MKRRPGNGKDVVAILLAVGLATAVNCLTFGVLYDAVFSEQSGLSENATQILTGAFGGILGVLGAYVGYKAGNGQHEPPQTPPEPDEEAQT